MSNSLKTLVPSLSSRRVIVVGDVILDEYLIGKTTRLSREAPIPVLEFESRQLIPGGAANPAANIAALGASVLQVGVIGADEPGETLKNLLRARGIATSLLIDESRPTTVKMRLMAHMGLRFPQQVARLDTLSREPISESFTAKLAALIADDARSYDAILVSDYHCGLVTPSLIAKIREVGHAAGLLLTADAQGSLEKYVGFDLVKCNADEACEAVHRELRDDADFAAAARELCDKLMLKRAMMITRGAAGITFAAPGEAPEHYPAPKVSDVYDTVGAGDTVIAILTLALAAGASLSKAAALANLASGLVVQRVGNYTPSQAELLAVVQAADQ